MGKFFRGVFTLGCKRSLKHDDDDAVVALRGYLDRKIEEWGRKEAERIKQLRLEETKKEDLPVKKY